MNKTRLTILPILAVIFALFFGCSTIFGQSADNLENQVRAIEALPSGSVFTLRVTDDDISATANKYLELYMTEIQDMLQGAVGTKLSLSDPIIEFKTRKANASLRVGKGFLKVAASIDADVTWDGSLHVNVTNVNVPIVQVDAATVNAYLQGPVESGMRYIEQYLEIRSFEIEEGVITLEAMKK